MQFEKFVSQATPPWLTNALVAGLFLDYLARLRTEFARGLAEGAELGSNDLQVAQRI